MKLLFTQGDAAHRHGLDITIAMTAAEADALAGEGVRLTDWLTSALAAIVALRTGHIAGDPEQGTPGKDFWAQIINDLESRLHPRLQGVRDAAIRAHVDNHASYADLATAMGAQRSTAQRRRDKVTGAAPSGWETWAATPAPTHPSQIRLVIGTGAEPHDDSDD